MGVNREGEGSPTLSTLTVSTQCNESRGKKAVENLREREDCQGVELAGYLDVSCKTLGVLSTKITYTL